MNAKRKQRYTEKLELIRERLSNVREWYRDKEETKSRLATYKAFQELAEAAMDICAMICKDNAKIVKDDYANIETLKSLKIIDAKTTVALKEINGLRNRVVHEYNGISYEIFADSIEKLLIAVENFLGVAEKWAKSLKK